MKESLEQRLEKERDEVRRKAGMVIRAHILTYTARKHFKRVKGSVVTLQGYLRTHIQRKWFLRRCLATRVLQKHRRGQVARASCRKLREERRKREEEETKKREQEEGKKKGEDAGEGKKEGEVEGEKEGGVEAKAAQGSEVSFLFSTLFSAHPSFRKWSGPEAIDYHRNGLIHVIRHEMTPDVLYHFLSFSPSPLHCISLPFLPLPSPSSLSPFPEKGRKDGRRGPSDGGDLAYRVGDRAPAETEGGWGLPAL